MLKQAVYSISLIGAMFLLPAAAKSSQPAKTSIKTSAKTTPASAAKSAAPLAATAAVVDSTDPAFVEKSTVYIRSGSRYHLKGCIYLKAKGQAITIGDAMKQGYAPCNVCKAPKVKRPSEE